MSEKVIEKKEKQPEPPCFLKEKFLGYIKNVGEEKAQEVLEAYPSQLRRWVAGTHQPPLPTVSLYVQKVMIPIIETHFAKQLEIANRKIEERVKSEVAKAMEGFGTDITMLPKVADEVPVAPIVEAPAAAPLPPPAKVEVVNTVQVSSTEIVVPDGKETEFSDGLVAWLVKHREKIPENILMKLNDLYFPTGGRDLSVLFPCYKQTNPATCHTLVAIALDMGKEKMRFDDEYGDAMIYHARNKLADRFIAAGSQWSFWVDDDMIVPIGRAPWFKWVGNLPNTFSDDVAGRHVITRLMSHKKTVVGGCYFSRQLVGNAMYHEGKNNREEDRIARLAPNRLQPTRWVGTGCLLVHRQVFLDIQKKFPELAPNPKVGRTHWDYFLPLSDQPGEDVAFCHRAREAGHEIHVDLGLQPLHVGYASYHGQNTKPKFES